MRVPLTVNGHSSEVEVELSASLLQALRASGAMSVKHGCETGECGACTVLIDGVPRPSCVALAVQAQGRSVTTLEALGRPGDLHPLQSAFIDAGAIQCGYCTPGLILSALWLLDQQPDPDDAAIRRALSGNLCRCTGYVKVIQAVQQAALALRTAVRVPTLQRDVVPLSRPQPVHQVAERPRR